MKRARKFVLRAAVIVVAAYLVGCVIVALAYRAFLFPAPRREATVPVGGKLLEEPTRDKKTAIALRFGDAHPERTVVFFHGNGELASDHLAFAETLAENGCTVVLAEYRGYGLARAAGAPTESGIYDDAEAIVRASGGDRPILIGFSLGTGVAVEMAARGLGRALVLLAPYTSIPDVAQRVVPIFPMKLLMHDTFDSRSKAAAIDVPAMIAHGDRDEVVPFDMGETLAHTFPKGKFVTVSGAHHMDMFVMDDHLVQKIIDFIIDVAP